MFQKNLNWVSIGYLVVGVALIFWPAGLLQAVCYAVGGLVLIAGLSSIFSYLKTKNEMFSAKFMLVLGILVSGLGLFLLLQPKTVASILPLVVGLFVLVDGLGRLQTAWQVKKTGYEQWWKMALPSLFSALLGGIIVLNPFGTAALMVQVVGLILAIEGIINLVTLKYANNIFEQMRQQEQAVEQVFEEFLPDADNTIVPHAEDTSIDVTWKEL